MSLGCPRCGSLITDVHEPGCDFPLTKFHLEGMEQTTGPLPKATLDLLGASDKRPNRDKDYRRRLLANLRAMADGRGNTETIIGIAADELENAWNELDRRS